MGLGFEDPKRVSCLYLPNIEKDSYYSFTISVVLYHILRHNTGAIAVSYSPTFEGGRYQTSSDFEPMLAIDLPVTRAGVNLNPFYEKWGLESAAVSEKKKKIARIAQYLITFLVHR